jgi:8-oxo-dGTP diphosphatase
VPGSCRPVISKRASRWWLLLFGKPAEEIGVTVDEQEVKFAHVRHNSFSGGRMAFFFAAYKWAGEPENREPGKCSRLDWFSPSDLPYDLVPYCRVGLEWIAANYCFSAYGW